MLGGRGREQVGVQAGVLEPRRDDRGGGEVAGDGEEDRLRVDRPFRARRPPVLGPGREQASQRGRHGGREVV